MATPLCHLLGVGARGPLGLSALQVAMCARAGRLEPRRTGFTDRRGNAVGAVRSPCLPDDLHGYDRLVALGAPALREAAYGLAGPMPLLLALPEPGRPDDDPRLGLEIIEALARESGIAIDVARSGVVRAGHAGVGVALERAARELWDAGDPGRPQGMIVGGIDSYYHPEVLAWLDGAARLHSATTGNGILPSEGAAFVVVSASDRERASRLDSRVSAPIATVSAVVTAIEEPVPEGEPSLASAMTGAVRAAVSASPEGPVRWVLSDLNGERHRITEYQRVSIRSRDLIPAAVEHLAGPEHLGDTGAASGALLLAIACSFFRARCAPAERALILLHAEGPERAAIVLDAAPWIDPAAGVAEGRPEAPARREAPIAQEAIDRAILSLRRLPAGAERAPIQGALDEALASLSRWAMSDLHGEDHLPLLDASVERVLAACRLLEALGEGAEAGLKSLRHVERGLRAAREATIDRIVSEQDRVLRGERPAEAPALPFVASVDVPALHATSRGPLVPLVDVARPGDRDLASARARAALPATAGEALHIRRLARDGMEDIAILGTLREGAGDEPWAAAERFERRLLANVDALLALDAVEPGARRDVEVLPALLAYAVEPAFVDRGRAFARAFALGCVGGEDAVRAAVAGLRHSPPATHAVQRSALCLASSPRIDAAMERLLWDEDPAMVRLAVEVLGARRKATLPALLPLLSHADPGVIEAVLRCLGKVEPRAAAVAALEEALLEQPSDRARLAAAESLVRLGAPAGLALVVRRLHDDGHAVPLLPEIRAGHVRLLSLAGGAEHAAAIAEHAVGTPEGAAAVGWFGHVGLIPPLLVQLEAANALRREMGSYALPFELAAARALVRITGVYLEDPGDGLDVGISLDAPGWAAFWEREGGGFRADARYRFGKPYHPLESLSELEDPETPAYARRDLELELAALLPGPWGFEPGGWVARQRGDIDEMRQWLSKGDSPYEPGEWPMAYLQRRGMTER